MELIITQWLCSPACTELEQVVLDWMAKMLGLSSTFYTSSGIGGGIIMVCVRMYSY
jgi:aromatic-L-amino-acid decarboxylase